MKKSPNQNKSGLLDWMLSIDLDPVVIIRVKRDVPTAFTSLLDEKAIEPKRGD
jgi:hypothetical protein